MGLFYIDPEGRSRTNRLKLKERTVGKLNDRKDFLIAQHVSQ